MISAKDIQLHHVHAHDNSGHFTEISASLLFRPTERIDHAKMKSGLELDAELKLSGERVKRRLLNHIYEKGQSCLEKMLKRGEAWLCQCGSINGNLNTRCCQCGEDAPPTPRNKP